MSQQGGRPTGHEDDWWGQLYDDSTGDTGPAPAADSLDDRFASASGALDDRDRPAPGAAPGAVADRPAAGPHGQVPAQRAGTDAPRPAGPPPRAPWEPPPPGPAGPVTFPADRGPAGQEPPGRSPSERSPVERSPGERRSPIRRPAGQAPPRYEPSGQEPPGHGEPPPRDRTAAATGSPTAPPPPVPAEPPAPTVPASWLPPGTPPSPPSPPAAPPARGDGRDRPVPPAGAVPARPAAPPRSYVGSRPPTYDAEPTALPPADPDHLDDLVADTVLDGARYGACALRAASVRGDSARYRGEPRRDALLTARFGTGEQALVLVAMATGARAAPGAHRAAAEACRWIGRAVGRSHPRLVEDIRAARRGDLKSGLHRLTGRTLGRLRAGAVEQGLRPQEYPVTLRCLLLPADPECRTRVFFGVGAGGLFRLRDDRWQDIEPQVTEVTGEPVVGFGSPPAETPGGDRLTMDLGIPTPPSPYEPAPQPPPEPFRFRASVARPGDVLLMCSAGLAEPLHGEPELCAYLAQRWSGSEPPGLAAFLADTQVRVKGYADDRTAAAVWEA
ncbi:protein phosphatase 2C domain-containing protein [Streptomyces sp. NPDC052701]|uniref:protein phosphatase 2C domain-containing protein n=1 Tax=Streptomyces sp. NPDC052701 TaxID=3155533 RepID=UPI00343CF76A